MSSIVGYLRPVTAPGGRMIQACTVKPAWSATLNASGVERRTVARYASFALVSRLGAPPAVSTTYTSPGCIASEATNATRVPSSFIEHSRISRSPPARGCCDPVRASYFTRALAPGLLTSATYQRSPGPNKGPQPAPPSFVSVITASPHATASGGTSSRCPEPSSAVYASDGYAAGS